MDELIKQAYEKVHYVTKLVDSLDFENLRGLSTLLTIIRSGESGQKDVVTAYYDGYVKGVLHSRHDFCTVCNQVHDDDEEKRVEHFAKEFEQFTNLFSGGTSDIGGHGNYV